MVLTVSFALPGDEFLFVTVASRIERLHVPGRAAKTSARLDTSNGCQDHTTSPPAIMPLVSRASDRSRISSIRPAIKDCAHDTVASTASHPNVRDDRDTPLVRDETASVISLIWGGREAEYFCAGDSTENSNTQVICPSGARVARRRARKDRAMGKRLGFARGPRVSVLVGRCL